MASKLAGHGLGRGETILLPGRVFFGTGFKKNTAMDGLAHTGHPLDGILHKGIPPYGYAIIPAARPARPSLALDEFFLEPVPKTIIGSKKNIAEAMGISGLVQPWP